MKKKSVERVKETPSTLMFTSPAKRQVISELISTRNAIKNKFKKAYIGRMKRERALKKFFKPITTTLETLKPKENVLKNGEKKKKKKKSISESSSSDDNDDAAATGVAFETSQFKPKRFASSTPKRGILHRNLLRKPLRRAAQQSSTMHSDIFHSVVDSGGAKSKNLSKSLSPVEPRTTRQQLLRLPKLDVKDYTYKIEHDDDSHQNYDKQPADAMILRLNKTHKNTGERSLISARFIQLPKEMQKSWVQHRKDVYSYLKQDKMQKALQRSTDLTTQKYGLTDDSSGSESDNESNQGAVGGSGRKGYGLRKNDNSIDFNFIPYNINNRIVYEYFDDPNELCDRLQLLVSSRMAGNTNHMQEISSIIEELRELGCIA